MSFYKKISVFSVLSLLVLSVATLPLAGAQDNSQENGGSGLQLSPTRTELSVDPGEQKSFKITIKNVTQGNVTAKAFLNDFESDGTSGTPKIIVEETTEPTPYSLKDYLTGLQDVPLAANESKEVELGVNMPGDVAPGAYFGAIRYAAVPEGQDGGDRQVSLTASVAHLVFVEVPGDVNQQIQIEGINILNSQKNSASFFEKPEFSAVTVKNLGNGFSRPFGKVTVYRGSSEVYSYDVNNTDPRGIVLPQSSRVFEDAIKNVNIPGKYKVSAAIAYGNGGEVVNYDKSFWYLPLWFLGVVVLVIILIVVGGWFAYKKYTAKKFGK